MRARNEITRVCLLGLAEFIRGTVPATSLYTAVARPTGVSDRTSSILNVAIRADDILSISETSSFTSMERPALHETACESLSIGREIISTIRHSDSIKINKTLKQKKPRRRSSEVASDRSEKENMRPRKKGANKETFANEENDDIVLGRSSSTPSPSSSPSLEGPSRKRKKVKKSKGKEQYVHPSTSAPIQRCDSFLHRSPNGESENNTTTSFSHSQIASSAPCLRRNAPIADKPASSTRPFISISPQNPQRSSERRNANNALRLDIVVRKKSATENALNSDDKEMSVEEVVTKASNTVEEHNMLSRPRSFSDSSARRQKDHSSSLSFLSSSDGGKMKEKKRPELKRKKSFTEAILRPAASLFTRSNSEDKSSSGSSSRGNSPKSKSSSSSPSGKKLDTSFIGSSGSSSGLSDELDEPSIFEQLSRSRRGIRSSKEERTPTMPCMSYRPTTALRSLFTLVSSEALAEALIEHGAPEDIIAAYLEALENDPDEFVLDVPLGMDICIPIIVKWAFMSPLQTSIIETYLNWFILPEDLLRALYLLVCEDARRAYLNLPALPPFDLLLGPIHFRAYGDVENELIPLGRMFWLMYGEWMPKAFQERVKACKGSLEQAMLGPKPLERQQRSWRFSKK